MAKKKFPAKQQTFIGRPTKYGSKIFERAIFYINNYKDLGDLIPSIVGLSVFLGVSRETIYAWSKDKNKPEFSDIFEKLMIKQEINLINGGLSGEYNPFITKMMLTKHGYSDKQKTDIKITGKAKETPWNIMPVKVVHREDS